ncbi:MAG: PGPGW domain-containing protein [Acidobacteria bacterium]|nr:PGPGW domain-containing protein [Acidobacteriota bacterium]
MAAVKRWVRIIAGFVLIGLGIAGLFLPFLQGIAMIVAGLLLLAPEFRWARRLLEWAKRRWHQGRGTVRD